MQRWKLTLEYDGTGLVGWQRQDNGPSVQAALEDAAARLAERPVTAFGAGRTDAGVHATGQVAHIDIDKKLTAVAVAGALNFWLKTIGEGNAVATVIHAEPVGTDFHARFTATGRRYLYRILNRTAPPVLERNRAWWLQRPLDADAMNKAARLLQGHHDFSTFRAAECQASSPFKTLDRLEVAREGEFVLVSAAARSFLHHQVRNIVGTLTLVGHGKWSDADLQSALEAKDRRRGGQMAPAYGLYLVGVSYDQGVAVEAP